MLQTLAFGGALAKRFVEDRPETSQPSVGLVFLGVANLSVFIPVFFIVFYTFQHVYPALAAVEDPLPPYESLAMNDDDGQTKNGNNLATTTSTTTTTTTQPGKPITSSIRETNRLIRSLSGWLSNFRGLGFFLVVGILTGLATLFLCALPFVPRFVAHLLALLIVAPLSTTWTHVVITRPSAKSSFQRVPPLKKTYRAIWLPTVFNWAAITVATYSPVLLARLIDLPLPDPERPDRFRGELPAGSVSDVAKWLAVFGVSVGLQVLLCVPAQTVLMRVQASLLPPDEDTVVPFDRSFGGRVEPEVVTGKGFATFGAALNSITRDSWVRIYMQRIKLFAMSMVLYFAVAAIIMVEVLISWFVVGRQ
ncbi:hypothetical protein VTH82DRAFT_4534 [Thermothelomyces myriococcoides]